MEFLLLFSIEGVGQNTLGGQGLSFHLAHTFLGTICTTDLTDCL